MGVGFHIENHITSKEVWQRDFSPSGIKKILRPQISGSNSAVVLRRCKVLLSTHPAQ